MGLVPAAEGQVVPEAKKLQGAPVLTTAAGAEGRRHPSYRVFAAQASLPPISPIVIDIDGRVKLDLSQVLKISSSQMTLLAEQFAVPVAVLESFQTRWLTNALSDTEQLARELRTTIIDYRYLETRWTSYHPSPRGRKNQKRSSFGFESWRHRNGLEDV
jgi:hypothetical protein